MCNSTMRAWGRYSAPVVSRVKQLATGGITSTSRRTAALSRHKAPVDRARYVSSGSRVNSEWRHSRQVPAIAAVTSVGCGIYLYRRRRGPGLMDQTELAYYAGKNPTQRADDPHILFSAAGPSTKAFGAVGDDIVVASDLPREVATLTQAPDVPPPITRDYPALVEVPLVTATKLAQLTSQYKYEKWVFNGTVPGPFIRARVGDVVEITLTNKDTTGNPHNIDCHAFTGPGGGAAVTTAEENETRTARFKLLHPGLYFYHCAAAPVPVHIANGMYGLMYVQPDKGDLPRVDNEYYVMQSEWYHEPPEVDDDGRLSDVVEFSYPNGLREEPQVITFNGRESALTRDRPLKARVGESVRIFFGNAGPNLTSSFHVIGSHFDKVYRDGSVLIPPSRSIQTVSNPPGSASIVDMRMVVPGTYALIDHAIFRLDKGAVGYLNVSGPQNPEVYTSDEAPQPCVGCKLHA